MIILFKIILTATFIVLISEIAKVSERLGALIASLPLITIFTLIWLYVENQEQEKIAKHAYYTFWYVLPTLPMFLVFPLLLKSFGFWLAIFLSLSLTIIIFIIYVQCMKVFGIDLTSL